MVNEMSHGCLTDEICADRGYLQEIYLIIALGFCWMIKCRLDIEHVTPLVEATRIITDYYAKSLADFLWGMSYFASSGINC